MAIDKEINNQGEYDLDRGEVVWNNRSGTIVFDNTTGKERLQLSHFSGANISLNNKTVSVFAPNNSQELVHGAKYSTSIGDNFEQVRKNKEQRIFGDMTMITGSPNFFTDVIAEDWIESNRQLAVSKTAPELNYGGTGNNSGAEFEVNGTTDSESGAVEGGSFTENEAQKNIQQLLEDQSKDNVDIESKMGIGGNINLLSCKHILLQAGVTSTNYDSGVIISNGRGVTQNYKFDGTNVSEVKTSVPLYESKDTSSAIPFGDIHISAGTKLKLQSGAGGVDLNTAGDIGLNSTGRISIGGAEVAIGGGTAGSSGRVTIVTDKDIFQESDSLITQHAPYINTAADSQYTINTPLTLLTEDCHIQGDLRVQGNLHVEGDIVCNGSDGITVNNGDVNVPSGDVIASGISLVTHTHSGVDRGSGITDTPIG